MGEAEENVRAATGNRLTTGLPIGLSPGYGDHHPSRLNGFRRHRDGPGPG